MGSRIRRGKHGFFELVVELRRTPDDCSFSFCLPSDYKDEELLKSIPEFAFPFASNFSSCAVEHFTFVLTDIDGKFRFGFCRLAAQSETCHCLVSYYPWFEIFYRLLNYIAEVESCDDDRDFMSLLTNLADLDIDSAIPGAQLRATNRNKSKVFSFTVPDSLALPSIPDNRNLTEYYSAIDSYNMMIIFSSMLLERRILVTSRKLSRLTACVHGAASLFHPFHWQHLYIPVLPPHLIDYCSAPMPYLIGIHSTLFAQVAKAELGDAVILDADANSVSCCYDDLSSMPPKLVSFLKKELGAHKKNKASTPCVLMGQMVAKAFIQTLVRLIGGYRCALVEQDGRLTFDPVNFVQSRSLSMQPFLERMLHLQAFEVFINERLQLLQKNPHFTDDFDSEIQAYETEDKYNKGKYKGMWPKYDKALTNIAKKVKSTGMNTLRTVQTSLNDFYETDFGLARRNRAEVKVLVTAAEKNSIARLTDNSTNEEKSSPSVMRETKLRSGIFLDVNKRRTFRLSSDDSEILDVLLQASLPLLSDGEMDRVFRKYSVDNLADSSISLSDDSDISRDNLSAATENRLLRMQNMKLFGNRDTRAASFAATDATIRLTNSAPNVADHHSNTADHSNMAALADHHSNTAGHYSNAKDLDILETRSNIADMSIHEANGDDREMTVDSKMPISGTAASPGNVWLKRNANTELLQKYDSLFGKPVDQAKQDIRKRNRLSVRYLPNVQQIIQSYERSSEKSTERSSELTLVASSSKSLPHCRGNESYESLVARQAAHYTNLDKNSGLKVHSGRTQDYSGRHKALSNCSSDASISSMF